MTKKWVPPNAPPFDDRRWFWCTVCGSLDHGTLSGNHWHGYNIKLVEVTVSEMLAIKEAAAMKRICGSCGQEIPTPPPPALKQGDIVEIKYNSYWDGLAVVQKSTAPGWEGSGDGPWIQVAPFTGSGRGRHDAKFKRSDLTLVHGYVHIDGRQILGPLGTKSTTR